MRSQLHPRLLRLLPLRAEHLSWSILHQVVTRALVVIKFFVAAKLLGPEAVGLVAVAILTMAIVEALTDTGLQQALIQNKKRLDATEAGALWTLQLTRGTFICLALLLLSEEFASLLNAPGASGLIKVTAFIAVIKNTVNPGPALMLRDRNFRGTALYEVAASATDLISTVTLILVGLGPLAMVLGTAAGETMKLAFSWFAFRTPLTPNTRWRHISHLTNFGKWIWGNSVLTLLLNQLDKILVARYLGVSELGLYQTAARICQLLTVEPALAFGQYLFPTYAKLFRDSPHEARQQFLKVLKLTIVFLFAAIAFVLLTLGSIIGFALGDEWYDTQRLARIFVFPMAVATLIAALVPYLRAIAMAKQILIACIWQLLTLGAVSPPLLATHGATGMIISTGIAATVACAYLFFVALRLADNRDQNEI